MELVYICVVCNHENNKLLKTYDKDITIDRIHAGEYDTNAPHSTSLHRHNGFQIVWIAKGEGIHTIEQKEYAYSNGSLFLLAPYFMHQIEYNEGVEGYVVSFSDTFLNHHQYRFTLLFYNLHQCFIKVEAQEQELLNEEFAALYHYFRQWDYAEKHMIMQNYLHIILSKIVAFERFYPKDSKQYDFQNVLEPFIALVRNHFKQEKKLKFYQDRLSISQRKLNSVISETAGISPAKFIEQYTLNEAARLILYSNDSIKEIAARLGYMDNSYFTKAFKKHFQLTPNQYKDKFSN